MPRSTPSADRDRHWIVGHGKGDLDLLERSLQSGDFLERAGLRPQISMGEIELRPGLGILRPFRMKLTVVDRIRQSRRRGLVLATQQGHALVGSETFLGELLDDGSVLFSLSEESRIAPGIWKLGAPIIRLSQRSLQERYGPAMRASIEAQRRR